MVKRVRGGDKLLTKVYDFFGNIRFLCKAKGFDTIARNAGMGDKLLTIVGILIKRIRFSKNNARLCSQ